MKRTRPVSVSPRAPAIYELEFPNIDTDDAYIQDWGWHCVSDISTCLEARFGETHEAFQGIKPLHLLRRYAPLNYVQGGLTRMTWAAVREARRGGSADYTILGDLPDRHLCLEFCYFDDGSIELYTPATWGMNVLAMAELGVLHVTVRRVKYAPHPLHCLMGHLADGTQRQILPQGNPPACSYKLVVK